METESQSRRSVLPEAHQFMDTLQLPSLPFSNVDIDLWAMYEGGEIDKIRALPTAKLACLAQVADFLVDEAPLALACSLLAERLFPASRPSHGQPKANPIADKPPVNEHDQPAEKFTEACRWVLDHLSNDLCMVVMRESPLPLHRLLRLLPQSYHPLAMLAHHPSIFSQHTLTFTQASAPMLTSISPLLVTSFPHLTSISLRGQPLPNAGSDVLFRGLGGLPRLARLDMSNTVWSPAAAAAAAAHLPAATALRSLHLKNARISAAALAVLVAALRTLRALRDLAIGSTDPKGQYCAVVGFACAIPTLQTLTLEVPNGACALFAGLPCATPQPQGMHALDCRSRLGPQWLRCLHISSGRPLSTRQLCGVSALKHLEDLRVSTWDQSRHGDPEALRSDALMHALSALPALTSLDLSMHVLVEAAENAFLESPSISRLTSLQRLRLSAPGATVSDTFLSGLADGAAGGLREFSLRRAAVPGARAITRVLRAAASQLEVLELDTWLWGNTVPHGVALGSLAALTALTALRLGRCRLDDGDAATVATCMVHMHALQEVALGCTRMSEEGADRLADALIAARAPIRWLDVVGNGGGPGRELAALGRALPRLHTLQELELAYLCLKHPDGVRAFAANLAAATGLTKLRLDCVAASQAACDHISASLFALTGLQRLEVQGHCLSAAAAGGSAGAAPFTRALAALTALTALCCVSCRGVSGDATEAARIVHTAAASASHRLRELRLCDCDLAASTIAQHAQHAQHGDERAARSAAEHLCSALGDLVALEVLDVSGNAALGDAFAEGLAVAAAQMLELRHVGLSRCGVGAAGLRRLLQWLPAAPRAQRLQVREGGVDAAEMEGPLRCALACCHVG